MSALSKTFVAILVVLSLLLSSAVIVWVNQTEAYKNKVELANQSVKRETAARLEASNEAQVAKQAHQDAIKDFNGKIETIQTELKNRDQEISKREVQIADLSAQAKMQLIAFTSASEALKASEAQKKLQQEQLGELRLAMDKAVKERSDLNIALSDTTNKLDVITREWRFMKEQLTETQSNADRLMGQVKDLGGDPAKTQATGLKQGAPAINGVVRAVRKLDDNRQWATISVGSADAVQQGMEFKVIDRQSGSFLGVITIQNVQPNESVGVLTGPKVADVQAGAEVRTQL